MCTHSPQMVIHEPGPQLHYRFDCNRTNDYHLWLLMKYDDERKFNCRFYLDGKDMRSFASPLHDEFHSYRTIYVWCWHYIGSFPVAEGIHELTILNAGL